MVAILVFLPFPVLSFGGWLERLDDCAASLFDLSAVSLLVNSLKTSMLVLLTFHPFPCLALSGRLERFDKACA